MIVDVFEVQSQDHRNWMVITKTQVDTSIHGMSFLHTVIATCPDKAAAQEFVLALKKHYGLGERW